MSDDLSVEQSRGKADLTAEIKKYLVKGAFAKLIMVAILFLSAGRLDWVMGWVLVGVYVSWDILVAVTLIPRSPGLIAERARIQEGTKKWDIVITGLAASLLPMVAWIVAGLNVRFGWSPQTPVALQLAAFAIVVLGFALVTWATASNGFLSARVRIQRERGHTVAAGGPYQYVRHPGYVGAIMFQVATPIMLGSVWALIPSGLAALLYILRTALEDKTLQDELEGYTDYAERVRYRLLPGVW